MPRKLLRSILLSLAIVLIASNNTFAQTSTQQQSSGEVYPQNAASGQCIPHSLLYEEQNEVLHYKCCPSSDESAKAGTQSNADITPTRCGETGYADGKRDSAQNKQIIWSYLTTHFKNAGFSDQQAQYAAAGIMGNAEKESAFMPDAVNGIGCSGFVQWCFGRKDDKNDHHGSTINSLMGWAAQNGGDWKCLSTQLDFLWHELTGSESATMEPLKSATSAGDAANKFEHYYERSNTATGENLGRDSFAEKNYREFSSGAPVSDSTSGGGSSTANSNCPSDTALNHDAATGGSIPPADCNSVVTAVKNDAKIKPVQDTWFKSDTEHCTTEQATCNNGVHPEVFRALEATAQNSGASEVNPRALNTGHPCDGKQHPAGDAMDFYCPRSDAAAMANCDKIFKYLYDNKDKLQIGQLIWNSKDMNAAGYQCSDSKVLCMEDHDDEIHIGIKR
jgi:Phage tail lysozyme